ncbi:hypothetical protein Acr_15g0011830 [Actinidia rufa]|uniref:Uncharacterized protein n=1 Tax=Actinidia rufa TaxID=165716 RepID=A0A7J0FV46_9ERIC|nr:hypothetical protein Acr_15g0011830 [Actinidia rufa]
MGESTEITTTGRERRQVPEDSGGAVAVGGRDRHSWSRRRRRINDQRYGGGGEDAGAMEDVAAGGGMEGGGGGYIASSNPRFRNPSSPLSAFGNSRMEEDLVPEHKLCGFLCAVLAIPPAQIPSDLSQTLLLNGCCVFGDGPEVGFRSDSGVVLSLIDPNAWALATLDDSGKGKNVERERERVVLFGEEEVEEDWDGAGECERCSSDSCVGDEQVFEVDCEVD